MALWLTLFYTVAIINAFPTCLEEAELKKKPEACRVPCNLEDKHCGNAILEAYKQIYKYPVEHKCESPKDGVEYTCYKIQPKQKTYTYKHFPPLTNVYSPDGKQDQVKWIDVVKDKWKEWEGYSPEEIAKTSPKGAVNIVTPKMLAIFQQKHVFTYWNGGKECEFEFVIMVDHINHMRFQKMQHKSLEIGHTSLLTKAERIHVLGGVRLVHIAGNFKVNKDGYIIYWDIASGHFQPDLLPGMEEAMNAHWFNPKKYEIWGEYPVTLDPEYGAKKQYENNYLFENYDNDDDDDDVMYSQSDTEIDRLYIFSGIVAVTVCSMSLLILTVISFICGLFFGYFGISIRNKIMISPTN